MMLQETINNTIMKKLAIFALLAIFAAGVSTEATAQKTDFNGKWKIDYGKSVLPEYTPALTSININVKGDSLLTERFYDTGDGQVYPFIENLTLDGKEYKIIIYDMPRKSKALWSEAEVAIIVESVTTTNDYSGPQDFISKETWKVDAKNKALVISFSNSMGGNATEGQFFLTRTE